MGFQPALAGVFLAADVLKHAMDLPTTSTTSTRINLLRPVGEYLNDPKARDANGRCICADEDFLGQSAARSRPGPSTADTPPRLKPLVRYSMRIVAFQRI